MRLLITGGAGFVGANIACGLAQRRPGWELIALDNLHRRGSELNLPRLREAGVRFVHGDVRQREDLLGIGTALTGWRPRHTAEEVLVALHEWISAHERELQRAL
jgi:dTDP-D-glucose 4,6-dehydratase